MRERAALLRPPAVHRFTQTPEEGAREAMAGRAARYRFTLTHRFTQPTEGVVAAKQ
jgi:hypothetical protein